MLILLLSALSDEVDRRALYELYTQYQGAMLRVARRYFPDNPAAAEDPADPLAPLPKYELAAVPEGYAFDREMVVPGVYDILYVNAEGELLWFGYQRMTQGAALRIETENAVVSDVAVNGLPGQLYHSLDAEESSSIVWIDEEHDLCFSLDGYFDDSELLHIAESVYLCDLTK